MRNVFCIRDYWWDAKNNNAISIDLGIADVCGIELVIFSSKPKVHWSVYHRKVSTCVGRPSFSMSQLSNW
jgi:hypothetical protein